MTRFLSIVLFLWALFICQDVSHSSTESARAKSIYFVGISDGGSDGASQMYARKWRVWMQLHRAIEKKTALEKELRRNPAHYNSDKGRSLSWIHKRLPAALLKSQPTHVYILQLAAFDKSRSLENFMAQQWPKVARKAVYAQTRKVFYVGFSSEAASKRDPLYVLREQVKGRSVLRLSYGIYESQQDAHRDAAQFKKYLSLNATIRKTTLTPQLAQAFIAQPVAGRLPGKGAKGFGLAW